MPSVKVNGININYVSAGDGPAIVFQHAYPTNHSIWKPQIDALSAEYRTIAIDMRGFNRSDAPADAEAYSQANYVEDMRQFLDAMALDEATICGLSMGGNIALHFAIRHPDRVARLILVDTAAGSEDAAAFKKTTGDWATAAETGGRAGFIRTIFSSPIFAQFADRDSQSREYLSGVISANDPLAMGHIARRVLGPRLPVYALEAELAGLSMPTLVIVGENDFACHAPGAFMAKKIPGATHVVIPGTGHFNNLERPDLFNKAVREFLKNHD